MFTLYVGDNDTSVAENAKKENSNAYLIDYSNWNQTHTGVAYTSLSDLPGLVEFASLLRQATTIVYSPPLNSDWSGQYWTEYYLTTFSLDKNKKIINFNNKQDINKLTIPLVDHRSTDKQQLWSAGCSVAYGYGILQKQRYSSIISKELDIPLSSLAKPSTSIFFSADQILKSDIRKNDILVWGITSTNRTTYYDSESDNIHHITLTGYQNLIKEYPYLKQCITEKSLVNDHYTFLAINQILQVVHQCRSKGIKLVLAGLLTGNNLGTYLLELPEYIHLHGYFGQEVEDQYIDLGDDNKHPGPKMHRWYADQILNRLVK